MAACITPTRLGIARRLRGAIRAAYLRALIKSADADIQRLEFELHTLPLKLQVHRDYISQLRVALIDAELGLLRSRT